MIKATFATLALLLGIGLCAGDKADASGCGRAEVQAITCGAVHLRPGQVRRMERRSARQHRWAQRRANRYARLGCAGVAEVGCAGVAAPVRCGGVTVLTPMVDVQVAAPVVE